MVKNKDFLKILYNFFGINTRHYTTENINVYTDKYILKIMPKICITKTNGACFQDDYLSQSYY